MQLIREPHSVFENAPHRPNREYEGDDHERVRPPTRIGNEPIEPPFHSVNSEPAARQFENRNSREDEKLPKSCRETN